MRRLVLLWALCLSAACSHLDAPGPSPAPGSVAPAALVVAAPLAPTAVVPEPVLPQTDDAPCPSPLAVRPRALATEWPALLGRRVRMRVRVVRALSFTDFLVTAEGERFVVTASPDTNFDHEMVFSVIGSVTVPLGGRTALPELVVDDGCGA